MLRWDRRSVTERGRKWMAPGMTRAGRAAVAPLLPARRQPPHNDALDIHLIALDPRAQ
jgi:hypothetical protein